jgi:hypothetical protein
MSQFLCMLCMVACVAACGPPPPAKNVTKVYIKPREAWGTKGESEETIDCKSACNITKDGPLNTTYNQVAAVRHVQGSAVELWVDVSDFTFTKSHSVNCWGTASFATLLSPGGCTLAPDAASVLDLHGTGYQFDMDKTKCGPVTNPAVSFDPVGSCKFSADHQRLDMTGGGFCGGYLTDPIVLVPV